MDTQNETPVAPNTPKKRILIVEDESSVSTMYAMKFERSGFEVKVAENGLDAVVYAVEFKPNAILLDIMMPSMNGFEALQALRNLAPSMREVRIVVFSNLSGADDRRKAEEYGADGYLVKVETTPATAVAKIEELLAKPSRFSDPGSFRCPHCGRVLAYGEDCCQ